MLVAALSSSDWHLIIDHPRQLVRDLAKYLCLQIRSDFCKGRRIVSFSEREGDMFAGMVASARCVGGV